MRNLTIYAFTLVMLFWVAGNNALAAQETSESNYLPVRTSLIPLLNWNGGAGFPPGRFPANRINPAAKEHIHYCFSDEYAQKMHPDVLNTWQRNRNVLNTRLGGIWLLGFIGNKDDIQFVDRFLQDSLTSKEFDISQVRQLGNAAGCFSGMMLRRGIEGAEGFFEQYVKLSSWMPTYEKEMSLILRNARSAHGSFLYNAYLYSRSEIVLPYLTQSGGAQPDIDKDSVDALLRTDVDFYTQYMKPGTLTPQELEHLCVVFFEKRGGSLVIDAIINKDVIKIPRNAATDSKPQKERKESVSQAITLTDPNLAGYLESLAAEAIKAYVLISEEILAGKFNDLGTKLLDDGKVVAPERFNRGGEKMVRSLRLEQAILADLRKAGLNRLSDCQIKVEVNAGLANFDAEIGSNGDCSAFASRPSEITGSETAIVTFVIASSADIWKKHMAHAGGVAIGDNDDLKVYMKRINGQWYWNPFGW